MSVGEILYKNGNNTISFGNYKIRDKQKLDIEVSGDVYKVKTHNEVTRLEKNGNLLIEAVPGANFSNFSESETLIGFSVEAAEDTQLTLDLTDDSDYEIFIDEKSIGKLKSSPSGKLNLGINSTGNPRTITIQKT